MGRSTGANVVPKSKVTVTAPGEWSRACLPLSMQVLGRVSVQACGTDEEKIDTITSAPGEPLVWTRIVMSFTQTHDYALHLAQPETEFD